MIEVGKVTAFITRDGEIGRQLLVFQHPTAGVQLPSGTVEPDEHPDQAILREISEETGLTAVTKPRLLDVIEQALAPDERVVTQQSILQASPGDHGTLHNWVVLRRGQVVKVLNTEDDYLLVSYREYGMTQDVLHVVSSKIGWLHQSSLTARVRRYFYHLQPTVPTQHTWTVEDEGRILALQWVPLAQDSGLIPLHEGWLAHVRRLL